MNRQHLPRTLRPLVAFGAAAALGGGLFAAAQAEDDPARRAVRIQPGELDRGPRAGVPHSEGRAIHADGRPIRPDLAHRPILEGRSTQGFVVRTSPASGGATRLWNIHRDGSMTFLARLSRWGDIEVSTDGTRVAFTRWTRGGVKVVVRLTRSGRRVDVTTFPGRGAELVGYGKRRVLMTNRRRGATFWYAPSTGDRVRIANKLAWQADARRNRIALAIPVDQGGYDGYCLRYAKLSAPRQQLWYSCKQKPVAWAGRGGKVLTTNIATDGLGPTAFQVRQADGKLLRTFRGGLFGSAQFTGERTILFTAQGPHRAALVRCTVGGDCERATRLRPPHTSGPDRATKVSLVP